MTFQDNLRKYREAAGFSQSKEFASKIGIPYSTYTGYENQGREPKYKQLCSIAAALHVTTDELLGYSLDEYARCKAIAVAAGYSITEKGNLVYVDDPALDCNTQIKATNSPPLYLSDYMPTENVQIEPGSPPEEMPVMFQTTRKEFAEIVKAAYGRFQEKTTQQLYDEILLGILHSDKPDKAQ